MLAEQENVQPSCFVSGSTRLLVDDVGVKSDLQQGYGAMHDLNVLALFKGKDRFIFVYDDVSKEAIIDAVRNCAANAKSSFNWFDAAVLTERAERQAQEAAKLVVDPTFEE